MPSKRHAETSIRAELSEPGASVVRVAAYCRYSSHLQDDGYSIEAQHAAILREAQHAGNWQITWYDDPAQMLIEPLGLVARPLGYRGWRGTSRQGRRIPRDQLPKTSCELVEVRIREPFRDLLAVVSRSADGAAG